MKVAKKYKLANTFLNHILMKQSLQREVFIKIYLVQGERSARKEHYPLHPRLFKIHLRYTCRIKKT